MKEKSKFYSDIQKYEIINLNDGEKYGSLFNHDLVIDERGNFKYLIINQRKDNAIFFRNSRRSFQIPWNFIKKIGTKTIIIDAEDINQNMLDIDLY